ncbi:MAG: hypothetical protein IPN43_10985 [Chitinophagaceae bacterium]|nr:hypothetical protein [Chitinophagaceae bacterium]
MAEGRVRNEGGGYGLSMKMEYFITDHQGNTRVSFEDNGTNTNTAHLTQENSYYAFGMQMAGSYMPTNPNKKLYNAGSEWQDDIEGLADYYSTFYREYDPIIGRFNGVDPMSESFESWTTYHYSYNNPVNFNDPMGDDPNPGSTYQPLNMRDIVDRVMTSYGWGCGWEDNGNGGGGGSYAEFKAHFNYLGSSEWSADQLLKDIADIMGQISAGKYVCKYIKYSGSGSFAADMKEVMGTTIGAYIVAMIEAMKTPVNVTDLILPYNDDPGAQLGGAGTNNINGTTAVYNDHADIAYFNLQANTARDPKYALTQSLKDETGIKITSGVLLLHELAHAADFIANGKGYKNYEWLVDRNDPNYNDLATSRRMNSKYGSDGAYWELRTVTYENRYRQELKIAPRLSYNGVELNPLWKKMKWKSAFDKPGVVYKHPGF